MRCFRLLIAALCGVFFVSNVVAAQQRNDMFGDANRIQGWINGIGFEFVETNEQAARKMRKGKIALQLHEGKPQVVSFRNIRVKELP